MDGGGGGAGSAEALGTKLESLHAKWLLPFSRTSRHSEVMLAVWYLLKIEVWL
jgi:hypothetical protein